MKLIHPMALLLKYDAYPPAVIAALLMHGLLVYVVMGSPILASDFVNVDEVERVPFINAEIADVNPQRQRREQQEEARRVAEAAAAQRQREQAAARAREEQAARDRAQREAAERAEQQRVAEARALDERRRAEAEEQRRLQEARDAERREQERLAQLQAERDAQLARQEAARRQAEEAAANDARNVQSYIAIIHDRVASSWNLPPSARNGMTAVVNLRLVPTGEVILTEIVRSSGDAAFDRSVLQAVDRAGRFPELQGMPSALFEANFRSFTLTFRPEDLLR